MGLFGWVKVRCETGIGVCLLTHTMDISASFRIARRAISKPVSISALGKDLKTVPTHDQVLQWFQ